MSLFRYIDALDRIEDARRGPQGLLDDDWFDTYASRPSDASRAEDAFAPLPGHDPFDEWYRSQLREAVSTAFARLRGRSPLTPASDFPTLPPWPQAKPASGPREADTTPREFWHWDRRPFVPLPVDRTERPEFQSRAKNSGVAPEPQSATPDDDRPDHGYPWYEPDASNAGPIVDSTNTPPTPESLRNTPEPERRGPEKPFRQLPNPSVDERDLERAERKHCAIVEMWRESGRRTSADHLERFLDGDGSTLVIERDEARSFAPIREAEQKNDGRFERSFFIGGDRGNAEKLASLKDGETTKIEDDFKVDYGPGSFLGQALDSSTTDFAAAFGRLGFKSEGEFNATRRGDVIEIEGIVQHGFGDRYDFNPGQPYASEPNLLERKGNAKSYDRTSSWQRRVTGTIRIDNGRLYSPRFTWEDIDR